MKFNKADWINFYPPFFFSGIRVKKLESETLAFKSSLKFKSATKNIMGTQYGGSIYSMCDPFFMLILMNELGSDYIVWDQAAQIEFIRPGRSDLHAIFKIKPEELISIKNKLQNSKSGVFEFKTDILDSRDKLVARVKKSVYVKQRIRKAS